MASAGNLESAAVVREPEVSLLQLPLVAGVLRRVLWLTAGSFLAAISIGPMFAPASAFASDDNRPIRIEIEPNMPAGNHIEPPAAIRCRSTVDGRQLELLALAQERMGSAPIEHVATRFWHEQTGVAEVTFEFWHGETPASRKLYLGRGSVDMSTCQTALISIT